jgi:Ca2+-transporting ATPase
LVRRDYFGILYVGGFMGLAGVALYAISPQDEESLLQTRALVFSLLALSPLFHAFSCRSPSVSAFAAKPLISLPLLLAVVASAGIHCVALLVPGLRPVFRTYVMSANDWMLLLVLSALIVPAVEVVKLVYRRVLLAEAFRRSASPASR